MLAWGALLLTGQSVRAGAFVWDGGSTLTSNWSDTANWNPNGAPSPTTANTFTFGGSTRLSNVADGTTAWTVTSMTFSSGAGAFNISSGTGGLKLSSTGIINNSTSLQTIAANIALQGTAALNTASGDLALTGPISGAFGLTKSGTSALTLAGANTFTGTTTLSAGTLNLGSSTALGTGTLLLNAGTVAASGGAQTLTNAVSLGGNATIGGSNNLTLGTVTNTSAANRLLTISNSGTTTLSGINLSNSGTNRTVTLGGTGDTVVTGTISNGTGGSGASILTKTNTGTLTLQGNNTFGGNLNLSAGTLNINNAGALGTGRLVIANGTTIDNTSGAAITNSRANTQTWNGSFTFGGSNDLNLGTGAVTMAANTTITTTANTLTIGGAIGGGFALTKGGAGELALGGANTFSGGVNLNAGTLDINHATALGTGRLTIAAGTTVDNTSGAAVTVSNNNLQTWNGNFTFGGSNDLNLGTGAVTLGANVTVTTGAAGNGTLTIGGAIGDGTNTFGLTKAGNGTLVLAGSNTYGGGTTIVGGTLSTAQMSGAITISSGTLQLTNSSATTIAVPTLGTAPTIDASGTGNVTFGTANSGNLAFVGGTGSSTLTLTGTSNARNTLFGGLVDAGAPLSLVKNGTGTWVLDGSTANGYTGNTIVNSGTLILSKANGKNAVGTGDIYIGDGINSATVKYDSSKATNQLANATAIIMNSNATFDMSGQSDQMGSLIDGSNVSGGYGNVILGGAALTIGADNANATFSGVISGAGTVTKSGTGTQVLAGNQTFTGALTVGTVSTDTGMLTLAGNNSAMTGGVTVKYGTLNINNANALGTGQLTLGNFSGTLTIDNTSGSAVTVAGVASQQWNNSFVFGGTNNLNLGTSAVTLGGSLTVTTNGSGVLTVGGAIGAGNHAYNLTKAGSGTLTLAGANTYSGSTFLNAGTLNINNASALGTGGFTIAGATTIDNTSGSPITVTGITSQNWNGNFTFGGSNSLNLGTGAVTLGGNVMVTTDTVGSGDLTVGGAIGGSYGVTKAGTGNMIYTGANSYSGATTISGGTLQVGAGGTSGTLGSGTVVNNASLVTNRSDSFTVSNAMSGTGSLTQAGTGTTTLSAANTYSGGTTVQAGTLKLANAGAAGAAGNTITLAGGTLDLATDTSVNAYNVIVTGDAAILSDKATAGSAGITHTLGTLAIGNQTLTVGAGSNVATNSSFGLTFGATTLSGASTFLVNNNGTGTGTLTLGAVGQSGTGSVTKSGSGTLVFSGSNTYTGGTTLSAGNLTVNSGATLAAATGALVVNGGTLNLNNAAQTVGSLNGSGGTIALGSGNAFTVNSGTNDSYAGVFTGASGSSLNKSGSGSLTLTGSSASFAGAVNVNAGSLIASGANLGTGTTTVASNAALGIAGNVTAGTVNITGTGISNGGALYNVGGTSALTGTVIVGGNATVGATSGSLTLANIGLSASAPSNTTLTFNPGSSATITVGGTITDAASPSYLLNVSHVGSGTVVLAAGGSDYNGNTTIGTAGGNTTGTLRIGANSALPVTPYNNASNITIYTGTLDLNGFNATAAGNLNLGGGAAGSTANVTTGTGTLTLNHDITYDATNSPNGGTISGNLALIGSVAGDNHLFMVNDSSATANDLTISASISTTTGNSSIQKAGTGTLVFSGNNTYVGATNVQAGILNIRSNTALGSTTLGTSVSANATLQLQGGLTVSGESLTLAGLGYGGNGALENVSGNNTWTGGIALSSVTTRIQSDSGTLTVSTSGITSSTPSAALQIAGAGNTYVASSIGTGITGGVTKMGSGTLTLAGGDSYSGGLNVQGGTVSVQNNAGLGTNNMTTVQSGATVAFDSTAHGNLTTQAGNITLNGTGVGGAGALRNTTGANLFNGNVSLASAALITANSGTTLTIGGATSTSNGSALTVGTAAQNGTVKLSGGGSLASVTVAGGTMDVAASTLATGNVNIMNSGSVLKVEGTVNTTGSFTAGASTSLLIASGGTVNVTGSAVFNSHTLDGSAGTLQVNGNNSLTFNGTISASSMSLVLNGGSVGTNASPLTVYLGGSNVTVGSIIITGDTILDFGNSAGTTLNSGALDIRNGAKVQVVNWTTTANNALLSTIWYANSTVNNTTLSTTNQTPTTNSDLGQISFVNPQGSVGSTTTWVADTSQGWFDHEIRPTPEPATYGAILISGCLGLFGFRQYRKRRASSAKN